MKIFTPESESASFLAGRLGIVLLLVAFIALAVAYSVTNPLHEATDELRHYRFVRTIATTGELPVQGKELCRSQSHHPPLYYAIGALATFWIDTGQDLCDKPAENPFWAYRYWEVGRDNKNQYLHGSDEAFPWRGEALAVYILRGINILIGAGVVWLTWATGRVIWPKRQAIALGAAALVAFNPMFLYLSGAINNDIIAAFSGSAILFACLYLLHQPRGLSIRWGLIFGVLYGLALMSKANLAATILLIEAAVTWVAWRKRQWRQWIVANALILLIAGLVAGWWFIRNQRLYGDLTGFSAVTDLWGARDPSESFDLAISELPYAWSTLWGRFGFGQIPLPQSIYNALLVVTIAGLLGAVLGFFRRATKLEKESILFLAAGVGLYFLVLFSYMLVSPAGPNGRFFFPAISALALLTFYGLDQWLLEIRYLVIRVSSRIRKREATVEEGGFSTGILALLTTVVMLILGLVALFGYLAPAYARPPSLSAESIIPNPLNAQFDNLVTLLGYELSTDTLRPGDPVDVDIYWEVNAIPLGDYLLFVHLRNENETIIAQRDTHPGLGNFPSSQWKPGDRFLDSVRLYVPETAYSPADTTISIGLYDPQAFRLAITAEDGTSLGDSLTLGALKIESPPGGHPNPQNQSFNDEIRLTGYEYEAPEARPGDEIEITLYWQAMENVADAYIVEVTLLGDNGQVWGTAATSPREEPSTSHNLNPGEAITDTLLLSIDPDTPDGSYSVEIALLNSLSARRVNIVANDGHWIDSKLRLAPIRVRS